MHSLCESQDTCEKWKSISLTSDWFINDLWKKKKIIRVKNMFFENLFLSQRQNIHNWIKDAHMCSCVSNSAIVFSPVSE